MRAFSLTSLLALTSYVSALSIESRDVNVTGVVGVPQVVYETNKIKPKVFIISMFSPEANIWYTNMNNPGSIGSLFAKNITVPGFSQLFPDAHCTESYSVCQLTTGESEINAAVTIASLVASPLFDLTSTYFLIAGIAGINPEQGTTGDVAFSRYAIQVALQYEFDAREKPENFSTGYFPQGSYAPNQYPTSIYGTEVFSVSSTLRDLAASFASNTTLNDSTIASSYRQNYASTSLYTAATRSPSIIKCDTATSDVYFSGRLLGEAFSNTTTLLTNGTGVYCMTAQEDNATLEALLRGAINHLIDFSRIIIMRTASDFDRPFPGNSVEDNLLYDDQDGFDIAVQNIYIAGVEVVQGLLRGWDSMFAAGIKPTNYIGDIFGSLGGVPDFGPGSSYGDEPVDLSSVQIKRRSSSESESKRSRRRNVEKGKDGLKLARMAQVVV